MTGVAAISLPLISSRAVPKRYEETRPVLIQGCAHSTIIGLGKELHKKEVEKANDDKEYAIRMAEQAVWDEADKRKAEALANAREEAELEQKRIIKKLKKKHAKDLLEEALKVEMAMQKLAIEQVKQERLEGEQRLEKAVKETEERWQKKLEMAVANARKEEKAIAAKEAARVSIENKQKFDAAMAKAEDEKTTDLKLLRDIKDLEKAKAVCEAETREREIAAVNMDQLTTSYDERIFKLQNKNEELTNDIRQLNDMKAELDKQKVHVENCLLDTRKDFQDFIDNLPPYQKNQAEFMLPRVYLDELENKGYQIQMLRPPVPRTKKRK